LARIDKKKRRNREIANYGKKRRKGKKELEGRSDQRKGLFRGGAKRREFQGFSGLNRSKRTGRDAQKTRGKRGRATCKGSLALSWEGSRSGRSGGKRGKRRLVASAKTHAKM